MIDVMQHVVGAIYRMVGHIVVGEGEEFSTENRLTYLELDPVA